MPAAGDTPPPLALTMGDPAGIGLDIALMAWHAREDRGLHPFVLYADPAAVTARSRALGLDVPTIISDVPAEAAREFATRLPMRPVVLAVPPVPGQPDPRNAPATIAAIEAAVHDVEAGAAGAVVTNPIAKSVLYEAGFAHPGHTEFLAALAERHHQGRRFHPVMMLAADELRVVPLTIHVPLASVPGRITRALIFETVRIVREALSSDFGIAAPRIAVAGLNPHAGENGTIGREDADTIAPAVASLRQEGIEVFGPLPADTMFHDKARRGYDCAIAMYHDQALIPLKTLAFDRGVNVTLGLPFVRTSPDHGTAFDIAGSGRATPDSLIEALKLAHELAAHRRAGSGAAAR